MTAVGYARYDTLVRLGVLARRIPDNLVGAREALEADVSTLQRFGGRNLIERYWADVEAAENQQVPA